ncbi:MAG: hypothetical protein AB7F59_06225 [Bdellovibrionales bacterium]
MDKNDGSDERQFLHDMATPLGTAMLLTDSYIEDVKARPNVISEEVNQLTEIYAALEKLNKLLMMRREVLIKRGVPSART